jgi:hypothetical protein
MDERYQQQPPNTSAYPQYYSATPPQPLPYQSERRRTSFLGMVGRMLRLILRRLMYGLLVFGRILAPHKIALALALPLIAVIGLLSGVLVWERVSAGGPTFSRADSIPPGSQVERFIEGQRKFDVETMWDSFSAQFQASMLDKGRSKSTLKAELQKQKLAGLTYFRTAYIGGVKLDKGGAMYFYVVDVKAPQLQGTERIPFTFTVDEEGKITDYQ